MLHGEHGENRHKCGLMYQLQPQRRKLVVNLHAFWKITAVFSRFGKSQLSSLGQLTHTRQTDDAPEPDGTLRTVARAKIRHYRQLYINRPEPIPFMPVVVDTTGRIYEDLSRLLFLHAHREASALPNEIPEESEQFRFLRAA